MCNFHLVNILVGLLLVHLC